MAGNPYFRNLVLGMHMDDTGLTDIKGHVMTLNGGVSRSNAQSKFGGYSALFNGSTGSISTPYSADFDFGTGDFSIRCWAYIAGNSPARSGDGLRWAALITNGYTTSGGSQYWDLGIGGTSSTTGTSIQFNAITGGVGKTLAATVSISQGGWHYIEVCRQSGVGKIFLDGVSLALTTNTLTTQVVAGSSGNPMHIGRTIVANYESWFNGYIDDVEIYKGLAPNFSNYTPPTATFADRMVQVSGIVKDVNGALTSKPVHVHRQSDGALAGVATSNATTGAFAIDALDTSPHYATCIYSDTEMLITQQNLIPV